MDIDNAPAIGLQQHIGDYAHIPRKAHQIHSESVHPAYDLPLVISLAAVVPGIEDKTLHSPHAGLLHHCGGRLVADHQHHIGIEPASGAGIGDGLEIGSRAAREHGKSSLPLHIR